MNTTYSNAMKALRKVGCAHAEGDALRAMCADLIAGKHGGKAPKYYAYLCERGGNTSHEVLESAKLLLQDRSIAWDVLLGIYPQVPA